MSPSGAAPVDGVASSRRKRRIVLGALSALTLALAANGVTDTTRVAKEDVHADDVPAQRAPRRAPGEMVCPGCTWSLDDAEFGPEVPYAAGNEDCPDAWSLDVPVLDQMGVSFCPVTGRVGLTLGKGPSQVKYFSAPFKDSGTGTAIVLGGWDQRATQFAHAQVHTFVTTTSGGLFVEENGRAHVLNGATFAAPHDPALDKAVTATSGAPQVYSDDGERSDFQSAGYGGRNAHVGSTPADGAPTVISNNGYAQPTAIVVDGETTWSASYKSYCASDADGGAAASASGSCTGTDTLVVVPDQMTGYGGLTYAFTLPSPLTFAYDGIGLKYPAAAPFAEILGAPEDVGVEETDPDDSVGSTNGNDTHVKWAGPVAGVNGLAVVLPLEVQETEDGNEERTTFTWFGGGLPKSIAYDDRITVGFKYGWSTDKTEFWVSVDVTEDGEENVYDFAYEVPATARETTRIHKAVVGAIGPDGSVEFDTARGYVYANALSASPSLEDARMVSQVLTNDEVTMQLSYDANKHVQEISYDDGETIDVNWLAIGGGHLVPEAVTLGLPSGAHETLSTDGPPGNGAGFAVSTGAEGGDLVVGIDRSNPSLVKVTAAGMTDEITRDAKRRAVDVKNVESQRAIHYDRDSAGRVTAIKTSTPNMTNPGGATIDTTESIQYDPATGRVTKVQDDIGNTMTFEYDARGRVTRRVLTYVDGTQEESKSRYFLAQSQTLISGDGGVDSGIDAGDMSQVLSARSGSVELHTTDTATSSLTTGEQRDQCGRHLRTLAGPTSSAVGIDAVEETEWGEPCLPFLFVCNKTNYEKRYPGKTYGTNACSHTPLGNWAWCDFICQCAIACACTIPYIDPFTLDSSCLMWEDYWSTYTGPLGGCADESPPYSRCPP